MNCNKVPLQNVNNIATFNKVLADKLKRLEIQFCYFLLFLCLVHYFYLFYIFFLFFKVKDIYLASPEVPAIHWGKKKRIL